MQNNYPNYGSQAPYAGPAPTSMPPPIQKKRHLRRALFITLLIVATGVGVLRYFGPMVVTQSFMNDIYNYKASDALNLVCPAEQAQAQQEFQSIGIMSALFKLNIDTSHISYTIQNESMSDATVLVTGSITANSLTSQNVSDTVTLTSTGFWWCVNTDSATPS